MKTRFAVAAILLLTTIVAAVPARAQNKWMERFGGQMGVYLPGSVNLQSQDGRAWFNGGVTYRLLGKNNRSLFSADAYLDLGGADEETLRRTSDETVRRGRMFAGMGLSARVSLNLLPGVGAFYAGAGGGLYHSEIYREYRWRDDDYDCGCGDDDDDDYDRVTERSHFGPGYKLFAGLQLHRGFFVEGAYHRIGARNDVRFDGFALTLGYRH